MTRDRRHLLHVLLPVCCFSLTPLHLLGLLPCHILAVRNCLGQHFLHIVRHCTIIFMIAHSLFPHHHCSFSLPIRPLRLPARRAARAAHILTFSRSGIPSLPSRPPALSVNPRTIVYHFWSSSGCGVWCHWDAQSRVPQRHY